MGDHEETVDERIDAGKSVGMLHHPYIHTYLRTRLPIYLPTYRILGLERAIIPLAHGYQSSRTYPVPLVPNQEKSEIIIIIIEARGERRWQHHTPLSTHQTKQVGR